MKYALILVLIPVLSLSAWAQEKEPEGRRICRIVYPERPKDAPRNVFLFDGKESREVWLPSMNFSKIFTLPDGEITLLMTADEIKDTDPENLPPDAPRLKITEDVEDFYILITPDTSNPLLPVRMNLVNTTDGRLKPGETLWFNLTDHRIQAKLGGTMLTVDPKRQTISKSPVNDSNYYRAEFTYQPLGQGKLQRITEQFWWHDVQSRHVGFIVNTGGRLPRIYFYRDFRL